MTVALDPAPRRRRRFRRPFAAVLVVVLLLVAAAGWYFSSQIGSGALDVKPYDAKFRFPVTAVSADSITVDNSAAVWEDLDSDVLLGLTWPGGFGLVTGAPTLAGDLVTRDFDLTEGTLPAVGDQLAVSRDLIVDPATDPAIISVTYPADGGDYPAWFVPGTSTTWAILVHGKGSTPAEMWRLSQATRAQGLPTLMITYRNDRGTTRDPSGHYGFGATEWHDLDSAVQYATGQGATAFVLGGASMGGGIVASYLKHHGDSGVTGVVLDAPMLDLGRTIDWGAAQLPFAPTPLTALAKAIAAARYDVDWGAVDYIDDHTWDRVPTLILHTTGDLTVPITASRDLATVDSEVTLEEFEGDHVASYNDDPERYLSTVEDFLAGLA